MTLLNSETAAEGNGRFPDNHFPRQDVSHTRRFPNKTFPGQDVSRTICTNNFYILWNVHVAR